MTLATKNRSLPGEIEEALGRLREQVAAFHNTDRLLKARHVGPKVLLDILPELVHALPPLCEGVRGLVGFASTELKADFVVIVFEFEAAAQSLGKELRAQLESSMSARTRLLVERHLSANLKLFQSTLEHLEWMIEATRAEGVQVSLGELLLSQPAIPNPIESIELTIQGPVHNAQVLLPARVGTRAIALFAGETHRRNFRLDSKGGSHILTPLDGSIPDANLARETFRLPKVAPLSSSLTVTSAVLARSWVETDLGAGSLSFPDVGG
jgi:hypothetical protein